MKNTFGNHLSVTLFGESHGKEIGAVLDGLASGIAVDEDFIRHQLTLRRPFGDISTSRVEPDAFRIISGVFNGVTTGTPLCILIPNTEAKSQDYSEIQDIARPGHADYTAYLKYHGYADTRGGGHFSGRLTAPLVAAGAIILSALKGKRIELATHIARCAKIDDLPLSDSLQDIRFLNEKPFAVLDKEREEQMKQAILAAAHDGDSVGGILETVVLGLPGGIGEPWFDTVEGLLSHALFSIPAVKGVEFGDGFSLADMRGHEANDAYLMDHGQVVTKTNHNGGIGGGITNGMPLRFRCAVKPTPSIHQEQQTVNLKDKTDTTITLHGRHDPAILHRARVVVDSVTALVLYDLLCERFGTDFFGIST